MREEKGHGAEQCTKRVRQTRRQQIEDEGGIVRHISEEPEEFDVAAYPWRGVTCEEDCCHVGKGALEDREECCGCGCGC